MRKYNLNDNYFDTWSEQKAYWLGFLAADGCVKEHSVEFTLKQEDKNAVEQLKKDLSFERPVNTYVHKAKRKEYYCCSLCFTSEKIVEILSKNNIVPRKSFLLKPFLKNIPENYKKPFIVRFFDGDGHIGKAGDKIQFLGCHEDCLEIAKVFSFKKYSILPETEKGLFCLSVNSFQERDKFASYYQEFSYTNFVLERKLNRVYQMYTKNFQTCMINANKQKTKKTKKLNNKCKICGKAIGQYSTYCEKCSHIVGRKVQRPTKEELFAEIKNNSFLSLQKKYRVTDNAIRKWCKQYQLPYRKKDLKMILSEDN